MIGEQGATVRELQQRFHCRISSSARREKPFIQLCGCQSDVDAASKRVDEMLSEYAQTHETIDLPNLALPLFLNNGGRKVQQIQKQFNVSVHIDKFNLKMVICGDSSNLREARNAALDLIRRITILKLPSRFELRSAFLGSKGSHIDKIREKYHVSVRVLTTDEMDEIELEGFDDNVTNAAAYVQSWLSENWVESLMEDKELMGRVVIGVKGVTIRETEKKFAVKTKQIIGAQTQLNIFGKKKNVLDAKMWIESQLEDFKRTNFWCHFNPDHFNYAYELSRSSLDALQSHYKDLKVTSHAASGSLRCEGTEADIAEIREKFLAFKKSTENFHAYPCSIPMEHIGLVFGKEGKTRAYLQSKYNCRILPRRESGLLIIWGEQHAAEEASKEIQSIIKTNQIVTHVIHITLKQFHQLRVDRCRPIRSIHIITSAVLKLPQQAGGDGDLSISGTQKNVDAAKALVEAVFRGTPTYSYKYDANAVNTLFATSSFPMKLVVLANQCNISHDSCGAVLIRGELSNIHRAHAQLYKELMNLFPALFKQIPLSPGVCHYFSMSGKKIASDDPYVLVRVEPAEGCVYCMKRPEPINPIGVSRAPNASNASNAPNAFNASNASKLIITSSSANSINPVDPLNFVNPVIPLNPLDSLETSNSSTSSQPLPPISDSELSERLARTMDAISKEVTVLSLQHVLLCIDPLIIAHIVGTKGRQIKEINASTGATVEVVGNKDHVYIHGEIESVKKACERIKAVITMYQQLNKVIEASPSVLQAFMDTYEGMIEHWKEKYKGEVSVDVEKGQIRLSACNEKQTNDLKYTIESLLEEQQLVAERGCSEVELPMEEGGSGSVGSEDLYQKEIASLLCLDSLCSCLFMDTISALPDPWKTSLSHIEKILDRNDVSIALLLFSRNSLIRFAQK